MTTVRLVQLYVKCGRNGKPVWDSLHVKLAPEPKAARLRKFRNKLAPKRRKLKSMKDAYKLNKRGVNYVR